MRREGWRGVDDAIRTIEESPQNLVSGARRRFSSLGDQ